MKIRLLLFFVLLTRFATAQDFEGTIKWSMTMNITDPKLKAQMEEAEKKMKDPATQAQMKQMMDNPELKKMMESNPQMKAQMEMIKSMQNGGSMMPTGMTVKTKAGNALTKMEGGPMAGMETLFLKEKNESYLINTEAKTYSVLPKHESSTPGHEPSVTIKKTTETQKILNYTCTKTIVTVTEGAHTVNQVFWTTTELKGFDFKSLSDQSVAKGKGMYYKDLEGVPLKVEMTIPQGTMVMEAKEVKKQTLPASDFQLPSGFTQTTGLGQ